MLTFVELLRSRMHREARFSKHYEKINKDDEFHLEGLKLKSDEEPCGKFIPIIGVSEYVLFTSLGLYWIEKDNSTFFAYEDLLRVDTEDITKNPMKNIVLITKQSERIKFPKEYSVPLISIFHFKFFIAKILGAYQVRNK